MRAFSTTQHKPSRALIIPGSHPAPFLILPGHSCGNNGARGRADGSRLGSDGPSTDGAENAADGAEAGLGFGVGLVRAAAMPACATSPAQSCGTWLLFDLHQTRALTKSPAAGTCSMFWTCPGIIHDEGRVCYRAT